jgi:hypothetical protein
MALAMFCTAIWMKPSATVLGRGRAAGGCCTCAASAAKRLRHHVAVQRLVGPRAEHLAGTTPAGSCPASRWRRWWPAGRRAGSWPARGWRRRSPGRRESARRRTAGWSRRRRPRCGCSSSARACARRPPGSRRRARTRRRSGSRRCWCRPCRSRSPCPCPAATAVRAMPTMPPAGPERIASLPWKRCASVRPPEDCMKNRRTPGISRPPGPRSGAGWG